MFVSQAHPLVLYVAIATYMYIFYCCLCYLILKVTFVSAN